MFGCLRKVGCLAVIAIALGAGWLYRAKWIEFVRPADTAKAVAAAPKWEPITDEGASRARGAVEALAKKSGPVFANVGAADLASYVFISLSRQLPPSAEDIEATTVGDRVYVRARVNLSDFGRESLGPLASILGSHERMSMGGRIEVVHPGLAQFLIEELKFGDLTVPRGAIPKLLAQLEKKNPRPEGVAPNALPLKVPPYVADVRVGKGKVTIYKTVQ
jgi:hypothetical protein